MRMSESKKEAEIEKILQILDSAYEKAVHESPTLKPFMLAKFHKGEPQHYEDPVIKMVKKYRKKYPNDPEKQIKSIIRWHIAKSAILGFIIGLFGFITDLLDIIIKKDLQSFFGIQTKMVTAIVYIRGYDPKDDKFKAFSQSCMSGNKLKKVLEELGIDVKDATIEKLLSIMTPEVIAKAKKAVAAKLLIKIAKRKTAGIFPIVSGIVVGTMDALWTKSIAAAAKESFKETREESLTPHS